MPYKIIDAQGDSRFYSGDCPIEQKETAEEYIRLSENMWKNHFPLDYPMRVVEVE